MLASLTNYKKPLTKEDEKEEFDALYQLLQSMVKPSDGTTLSNDIIHPLTIKEEINAHKEESKLHSPHFDSSKNTSTTASTITDDIILDNKITASPDVFEIYKYIRPRGRPKGSKTTIEKEKKVKRKYTKKEKPSQAVEIEKKDSESSKEQLHQMVDRPRTSIRANGITCKCCLASFEQNTDYLLHLNTSDICMKVLIQPLHCQPRHELIKPLHMIMHDWLSSALTNGKDQLTCRHCDVSFKTIGNMNKHLYTSLPCNRMAYIEFKKIVSDY